MPSSAAIWSRRGPAGRIGDRRARCPALVGLARLPVHPGPGPGRARRPSTRCAEVAAALRPYSGKHGLWGSMLWLGPIDYYLGRLAIVAGICRRRAPALPERSGPGPVGRADPVGRRRGRAAQPDPARRRGFGGRTPRSAGRRQRLAAELALAEQLTGSRRSTSTCDPDPTVDRQPGRDRVPSVRRSGGPTRRPPARFPLRPPLLRRGRRRAGRGWCRRRRALSARLRADPVPDLSRCRAPANRRRWPAICTS